MTEALWLALAAGIGAIAREVIGRMVPSSKEKSEAAEKLAESQREFTEQVVKRVDSLDAQVTALRQEADLWRGRYFAERETSIVVAADAARAKEEAATLRMEVSELKTEVHHLREQLNRSAA